MDRSKMCAETFVLASITWWVRVGSWTSVQHVTVAKVARQHVQCRCAKETLSAKIFFVITVSAVQSVGMRMVDTSLIFVTGVSDKYFILYFALLPFVETGIICKSITTDFRISMETFFPKLRIIIASVNCF